MTRKHDLNRRRMRAAKAAWKRLTGRDRSMEELLRYWGLVR